MAITEASGVGRSVQRAVCARVSQTARHALPGALWHTRSRTHTQTHALAHSPLPPPMPSAARTRFEQRTARLGMAGLGCHVQRREAEVALYVPRHRAPRCCAAPSQLARADLLVLKVGVCNMQQAACNIARIITIPRNYATAARACLVGS